MASSPTTAIPTNLSCARCQFSEHQLGQSLLSCAGCRSIKYCSKECQARAWNGHKAVCRMIRDGAAPEEAFSLISGRATMRVSGGGFLMGGGNNEDEGGDDTIYHPLTSVPHRYDISASGPYDSITAVADQMIHNFGAACRAGQEQVRECRDQGMLARTEHITSAMGNTPNHVKTCRIVTESNAAVKAVLPGRVYVGHSADADVRLGRMGARGTVSGAAPLLRMDVHGSFVDAASATAHARQVAQGVADGISNGRMRDMGASQGYERMFAVTGPRGRLDLGDGAG